MAAPNLEVYNGSVWADVANAKVHNGTAFQAIIAGWVSQGASTWGQWKVGTGVTVCNWSKNAGSCSAPTCTQETHNVTFTSVGCNFSIHHIHIYQSENGGTYFSKGESNCGSSLLVNINHYFLKFGHTDTYDYKVEMHLDSDHSLLGGSCFTGTASSLRHESCAVCSGA